MTKSKSRTEAEYLKGIIRNMKSEIKHLKKRLGAQDKRAHLTDASEDLAKEFLEEELKEREVIKEEERCPKCGDKLDIVPLPMKRTMFLCSCGYRRTVKK